jgi:hypothetical protein
VVQPQNTGSIAIVPRRPGTIVIRIRRGNDVLASPSEEMSLFASSGEAFLLFAIFSALNNYSGIITERLGMDELTVSRLHYLFPFSV